jgi:hypothetical protein
MVNQTAVKAMAAPFDAFFNSSESIECDAEPVKPGVSASSQVCKFQLKLIACV